jgi:hypothetical protein
MDRDRCAVTISVDFDAETLWSGTFGLTTPSPMSRGDYDVRAALPRIHALLDRHQIPATFMVPAQVADEHPDACAEIAERGRHEVGYHGYRHESVLEVPIGDERELMKRGIARLEETFGATPRGNRSPPFCIGRHPRIAMLDELIRYIKGFPDVWFATHLHVAEDWRRDQVEQGRWDSAVAAR